MKQLLVLITFFVCTGFLAAQENWQPLFNGKDLSGFQILGGEADYTFADGILTGITKSSTPNTFLATEKIYGDFILEFSVNIEYRMNSGVQFRSNINEKNGRVFGYQCEIETSGRKWAGGIYDEGRRGWLYPLSHNKRGQNAFKNGTWNHYRIEACGSQIRTWVNGIPCANLVDELTSTGFIAFQVHDIGDYAQGGQLVQWKDIRILTENVKASMLDSDIFEISYLKNQLTEYEKRTGWRLLWDGQTTKGWRSAQSAEFPTKGWTMKNGILAVEKATGGESQNGGDIITVEQFSNFELIVDFKISQGANSGIKYFVQPELNKGVGSAIGLEFQILDNKQHPDAKNGLNGNRTLGALYDLMPPKNLTESNRDDIRYKQNQFNRARIVVKNGCVEHWLNDIKIVEYDRFSQIFETLVGHSKYKDIKSFGQFPAGHILLQDHGDFVEFKSIKIREFSF